MNCRFCNEEIGNCIICPYCEENQTKELTKNEEKMQKLLNKYELSNLSKEYHNAIRNINYELIGSGLNEFRNLLSSDPKISSRVQIQFLNSLVQQNWIIIRQLNEISKKLDK